MSNSPPKFLSVAIAAEQLEMSERRVREICQQHSIGQTIEGIRGRLLTPADVETIKGHRGSVGNPNFGAKFGNGKGKRKRRKKAVKPRRS